MWGEAVMHTMYLKNQSLTCHLGNKTPYKMLYGKKPSLEGLPVWGCKDKVHDMSSLKLDI